MDMEAKEAHNVPYASWEAESWTCDIDWISGRVRESVEKGQADVKIQGQILVPKGAWISNSDIQWQKMNFQT